jgi:hypothetical protein
MHVDLEARPQATRPLRRIVITRTNSRKNLVRSVASCGPLQSENNVAISMLVGIGSLSGYASQDMNQ